MRLGELSLALKHPWHDAMAWFMKALELLPRVEPLVKIVEYYVTIQKWNIAYMFIKAACDMPDTECILFVDKLAYIYKRWHLMGMIGFYVGKHEDGKTACIKAIETGHNVPLDSENLKFYNSIPITKQAFIDDTISKLQRQHPTYPFTKLNAMANMLWKKRKATS